MSEARVVSAALGRCGVGDTSSSVALGLELARGTGPELIKTSPIDGQELARFRSTSAADAQRVFEGASRAFASWRNVPGPERGRVVRRFGEVLRERKEDLATLVSWEAGKIASEAGGEVQ